MKNYITFETVKRDFIGSMTFFNIFSRIVLLDCLLLNNFRILDFNFSFLNRFVLGGEDKK